MIDAGDSKKIPAAGSNSHTRGPMIGFPVGPDIAKLGLTSWSWRDAKASERDLPAAASF